MNCLFIVSQDYVRIPVNIRSIHELVHPTTDRIRSQWHPVNRSLILVSCLIPKFVIGETQYPGNIQIVNNSFSFRHIHLA